MKKISVVTPMYNESSMVNLFLDTVEPILQSINGYDYEIVCVNDGSNDNTLDLLKENLEKHHNLIIVDLSRNWGQEAALCAGLKEATGDAVIPMDADLQDSPAIIPQLIEVWEKGYQVVNAHRVSRKKDSSFKRNSAGIYYKLLNQMSSKVKVPNNVNNFRLLDRVVVNEINSLVETNRVLRIQIPFVGFKVGEVRFERHKRASGSSHYSIKSMTNLAIDSLTSVSTKPLKWSISICLWLFGLFALSGITELVIFILKQTNVLPSINELTLWAWLIINVLVLLFALVCLILAIMSIYLGKAVEETQHRPTVIVKEVIKK